MKAFLSFRLLPCLLAALAFAQTGKAQLSFSGVYTAALPNNGPSLTIVVEDNVHIQVIAFDSTNQTVGVANGAFVSGAFSLNLSNRASVTGTVPASPGGPIAGNYANAGSTLPYSATYMPFKSGGSSIAGIYEGRVHAVALAGSPSTSLTRLLMIIDLNNNLALLETTFTGSTTTYAGGVGTVTASSGGGYTFSVFNSTGSTDPSFTGTFQAEAAPNANLDGALEGTITKAGGVAMDFDVFKKHFAARLANISTRGFVNTGQGVLIGGFIIDGGPKHVMIIARGPSLAQFGVSPVLADPKLQLFDGQTVIAQNDNWQTNANLSNVTNIIFSSTLDPADAVILTTLEPGGYTTIVSSSTGSGTGIALVEVYEVDWQ
jgi:hypothetical protein